MKSLATVGAAALHRGGWRALVRERADDCHHEGRTSQAKCRSSDVQTDRAVGITNPARGAERAQDGAITRPKWRAQGKPGARLAPIAPRAKMKKHTSVVATGSPEHPAFPAQWF